MSWFAAMTLAGWLLVVAAAWWGRSRPFALFVGIFVGLYTLLALAMAPAEGPWRVVFTVLHLTVYVNFLALTRPRMRPLAYRLLVSWPASFFCAGTLLALPWALASAFGFSPWLPWLPYLLAAIGLWQSLGMRRETVELTLATRDGEITTPLAPQPRGELREARPLRIVQITDPHLGPFMSVARLRRIAEDAVRSNPDLVVLTGDFLTMEAHDDPSLLRDALEPLRVMHGRVFACLGNHDHEALDHVRQALAHNDVRLLVDEACTVSTEAGLVQLVGTDFMWRDRGAHLARVCAENPRLEDATRVFLVHDPGAFRHLPEGEADLVLSGHTHGGQVGLVSLGLQWTFIRAFVKGLPDHGYWGRGRDRLYVHRGTGHYGFPLRLGVPAEQSVLHVHRPWRAVAEA